MRGAAFEPVAAFCVMCDLGSHGPPLTDQHAHTPAGFIKGMAWHSGLQLRVVPHSAYAGELPRAPLRGRRTLSSSKMPARPTTARWSAHSWCCLRCWLDPRMRWSAHSELIQGAGSTTRGRRTLGVPSNARPTAQSAHFELTPGARWLADRFRRRPAPRCRAPGAW